MSIGRLPARSIVATAVKAVALPMLALLLIAATYLVDVLVARDQRIVYWVEPVQAAPQVGADRYVFTIGASRVLARVDREMAGVPERCSAAGYALVIDSTRPEGAERIVAAVDSQIAGQGLARCAGVWFQDRPADDATLLAGVFPANWLFPTLLLLSFALMYALYRRYRLPPAAPALSAPRAVVHGIVAAGLMVAVSLLYTTILAAGGVHGKEMAASDGHFHLPIWLGVAFFQPMIEEVAMRAWLIPIVMTRLRPVAAIVGTSALFSLVHGSLQADDLGLYFLLGCILAVVWVRTRSLLACVVAHVGNNTAVYLAFLWS
ncbi:MAG: CPBP family intramembrane glutamic endopeptidase [Luteimonas sp.]